MRFRVLLLSVLLVATGCSLTAPPPEPLPPVEVPGPGPVAAEGEGRPEPPPQPQPLPPPEPLPPSPTSFEAPVAVILSSRAPAYELVATELAELLPNSVVYDLSDRSLLPHEVFVRIAGSDARAVVAIGLRATLLAREQATVPVVFAQVFNVAEHGLTGASLRGVAVLPPLAVQLDAWRSVSPGLASVGAIVGAGHEVLLDEAARAAESAGLAFHYRIAGSDREALYLFNRLVPRIDAFWLFPDNRILSADVLREMLRYAARHDVEVAVFNDALLEIGESISTAAVEADIAQVVMQILKRIDAGEIDAVPALTPLNEVRLTTAAPSRPSAARRARRAAQDGSL